jgi:hypothetical protein
MINPAPDLFLLMQKLLNDLWPIVAFTVGLFFSFSLLSMIFGMVRSLVRGGDEDPPGQPPAPPRPVLPTPIKPRPTPRPALGAAAEPDPEPLPELVPAVGPDRAQVLGAWRRELLLKTNGINLPGRCPSCGAPRPWGSSVCLQCGRVIGRLLGG